MLDLSAPLKTGLITFWTFVFGVFYSGCSKSFSNSDGCLRRTESRQSNCFFVKLLILLKRLQGQTPEKLPAVVQVSMDFMTMSQSLLPRLKDYSFWVIHHITWINRIGRWLLLCWIQYFHNSPYLHITSPYLHITDKLL